MIRATVAAGLIAASLTFAPAADAAGPNVYGSCAEAWQAPRSAGARECRAAGWFVSARLVVSAQKRVRMVNLNPCKYEDGSSQRRCVWFAGERGNGRGDSFAKMPGSNGPRFVHFRDSHKGANQ